MEVLCTRPHCPKPRNFCPELDDPDRLATIDQKYCTTCGMPLILGGRYLPLRLLGKGGFGAAFLAFDRHRPKNKCVIKQFQPSIQLSPQALETAKNLFFREADVLEDLGNAHLQIPDLFAFFPLRIVNQLTGREDQFFYLAQEYIDGQTLEEMLAERNAPFSEAETEDILEDLLKVLQFVHDSGVIHRDIKPSNIMRGKNGRLYLLDFGAVKQATTSASNPAEKSTTIYSAGYAPPEQQMGKQVSPATDLYALAVTCVTLLTHKNPDDLYDPGEKIWNWRSSAPHVSDRFAAILDRMLQPDPLDRFQSSSEVLQVLSASLSVPHPQPVSPAIPPPVSSPIPAPPAAKPARRARFTLLEVLAGAAFAGFEGSLLAIALHSVLSSAGIVIALMVNAGLVFALYQRFIEGKDLPVFAAITLGLLLIPQLQGGLGWTSIALIACTAGIVAIALTAFFRLIYQLILRLL